MENKELEMNTEQKEKKTGQSYEEKYPNGYKEHLYDKLPVTKKQMDVVVAVLIGLIALMLILGISSSV